MDERHHELLAEVASMYYEEELTQNAIANQLGLSRAKVYRLLKEARELNVVQITIDYPIKRNMEIEKTLKACFGLKDAIVLRRSDERNPERALQHLGKLTAQYLERQLINTKTMAICLGGSTYEVINAIRADFQANVQVAQAIGGLPYVLHEYDSSALTRQLAQKLGGEAMYLASPVMADSKQAASVIRSQRDVQRTLLAARQADIALIGIGNLDTETSGFVRANFIEAYELEDMRKDGAIGDIAWQIYQTNGDLYPSAFNERVIGITFDELRNIPLTIAVAMGLEKANAILGGLRSGVIDILSTDDATASHIIELNQ